MKGCLLRLALFPVIAAVTYVLLSIRKPFPTFLFPTPGAEVAAPIAGFFFWFAVLYVLDTRKARADLALALEGRTRHLRDGETAVVYGTLQAGGPLLDAPFTGEGCLGYHYTVHHWNSTMRSDQIDYEGWALAPSEVHGPAGRMAVLAAPGKELFHEVPSHDLDGEQAFARAEAYLKATDFGEPQGPLADGSRRERVDSPGAFRTDVRMGTPRPLADCRLTQKVLRLGDQVSVSGVYSERERGIQPDPDNIMKPFHIVPGGEAELARKVRGKRRGAVISALLGLIVVFVYAIVVV